MQLTRLFGIVYLLLNKKHTTAGKLAELFEVSKRTIYRDIEILSQAGIPIYLTKGRGGGISLLSTFILNKTVLTEAEKTSILSALQAVDAVTLEQTDTAKQKLSCLFGNQNTDWLEVDFSSWANTDEESLTFNTLKTAVLTKHIVRFLYHNGDGTAMERSAEPLKLIFKGQSWYLYAYCHVRQDFRFFKLRRIKELIILDEIFNRTSETKILTGEPISKEDWVNITLKLSSKIAFRVYDEFEKPEKQPDGNFIVTFTAQKNNWIYSYLATFGEHCEVLSPEDIRANIKEKLQKTLEQYS